MPSQNYWDGFFIDSTRYVNDPTIPAEDPNDLVLVERLAYTNSMMGGGRVLARDRGWVRVTRVNAVAHNVPFHELTDPLPEPRNCTTCGVYLPLDRIGWRRCLGCNRRAEETRNAVRSGGRRFGIELEFSVPYATNPYDEGREWLNYDVDDGYYGDDRYTPGERELIEAARNVPEDQDHGPGYDPDGCNCSGCRVDRVRDEVELAVRARYRREAGVGLLTIGARDEHAAPLVRVTPASIASALSEAGVPCTAPGYTHEVMDCWKIVTDGSLRNGYELVSPPLQWDRAAEHVRIACETLERLGCEATDDCGLHVHHDVGDLVPRTAALLARNWDVCQLNTDQLVDPNRLRSEWCYPPDDHIVQRQCDYEGRSLYAFFDLDGERYRPLNWTCWHSYGTIEVRMHESTLDPDEILAWVAYTQGIIEASMEGRELTPPASLDDTLQELRIRQAARPQRTRELLRQKATRNEGRVASGLRADYYD